MADDIVKALTIQISANDLTGGVWASIGKGVGFLQENVTAMNQAWELGAKIYDKAVQALEAPIEILKSGGEYAEAKAGIEALAKSYGIAGDSMVMSIRNIAEGSLSLEESTRAASESIKKGFSSEQTNTIFEFAKKYTDVMGGELLPVAQAIEQAIFSGKGKAVKPFGLDVTDGMSLVNIMEQLKTQTDKMGEGVFNFAESWKEATQSISDAGLEIEKSLNDLVGEKGFSNITDQFRDAMRGLENEAPTIAAGIFIPLTDAAKMAWAPIGVIFNEISGWLGITFDNTDTLGIKINTIISSVGNSFYDVSRAIADIFSWLISPIELALQGIGKTVTTIELAVISVAEDTGAFSAGRIAKMKEDVATIEQMAATGYLAFDTTGIDAKQKAFNETILKTGQAHDDLRLKVSETSSGIAKAGEEFSKAAKETEKHKDETKKSTDALKDHKAAVDDVAKAYTGVSDAMAKEIASVSGIITKDQEGVNNIYGAEAQVIATMDSSPNYGRKLSELKTIEQRAVEQKQKDRDILEGQINAQIALSEALIKYSKEPKVVEFRSPESPNTAEAIVKSVIDMLIKQANLEGTMVQA